MRFFVLISCVLAVASAAWNQPPPGGYHIPQITSAGVPLETPEVQAAKAAHFAAFRGVNPVAPQQSYQGQNNNNNNGETNYENVRYYGPHAYQTTNGAAKVSTGGVPLDTPEVQAAKNNHFGLFSQALSRNAQHAVPHYRRRRGIYGAPWAYGHHVPLITANGVPLDTPEVQQAKAAHFAAHANAGGFLGGYGVHAGGFLGGFGAPIHPIAGFYGLNHDGRPLDTPEVAHAKAAHHAAFNQAAALNGVVGGHLAYGLGHVPAVPADTPEVAHAKAAHLAAHAAASHHY